MTEDEAKTKWCHAMAANECRCTERCIGSECMAWRWEVAGIAYRQNPDNTYTRLEVKQSDPPVGFCGLAGKP